MTEQGWLETVLTAARPDVIAALLRYFRDVDLAEEAYQEACLRALKTWPAKGPPRDVTGWLVMVAKNTAIDTRRRQARHEPLPSEAQLSDLSDAEADAVERVDAADYRDDILRLLFICCHPELPATQQIALALRIVSGLSVAQIARAFLVSEAAMEQRITRGKARIAAADIGYETPGPAERAERVAAVAAMIYLVFNEGYSTGVAEAGAKAPLCTEAIRLARLLLRLYPAEPEVMGLMALLLLQHARSDARFDGTGQLVRLEDQDRGLWNSRSIGEGLALVDKALRHGRPGPYQIQASIAAHHSRAKRAQDTDWSQIDLLYALLEQVQPSPVVTLNRSVAVAKVRGAEAALALIEPLADRLGGYFYYHGARGAYLLELGDDAGARAAFDKAVSLARTTAEAAHIRSQIDRLSATGIEARKSPVSKPQK